MHRFSETLLEKGRAILSRRYERELTLEETNEILMTLVSFISLLGSVGLKGGSADV
jgi:DNA-directed RNA polymerase specialized sigma subunit